MQSVLVSGAIHVSQRKMMFSARSTRTTHKITGKQQKFQRNNILVNCFSVSLQNRIYIFKWGDKKPLS